MSRPLQGIRVVDGVTGQLSVIARYFAELGARVDRIVPCQPDDPNHALQTGKVIPPTPPAAAEIETLCTRAHVIVMDRDHPLDIAGWRKRNPGLVTMAVSDFGTGNSLSQWQATGPVIHALSGQLSRSGIRGREPLLPPGELAHQCAAPQAVIALLGALYRALRGGGGAHFDFSTLDGAVQALDPGFGVSGSATLGKPVGMLVRDRPQKGFQYPIFRCADGYARICLLAKRQWRGMFAWLGEPEQFASPDFDRTAHRYKSPDLIPFIAAFFANRTRADLEREGQGYGVPISGLMSLPEFAASSQMAARKALVTVADGTTLPNGCISIDGERMGPVEATTGEVGLEHPASTLIHPAPFGGLKVLDLGVIVVGAEQGRLMGDLGADVVKVESGAFPDGNRQSYLDHGMSVSFAAGHRNKRSLGIDLRKEEGRALFLELVRQADVICSNFKPGTMDKLGLGNDVLRAVNPRLIISESSAFGDTGPWSGRMGYGPLVRAATGLTLAWRYPDDPESFSDSITIYPDHVAARICAIGVAALLIRRLRTKAGGVSKVAQSEVMLSQFAADVLAGREAGGVAAPDWPWGVFPTRGEDEWCVVTVRSNADWAALCDVIGDDAGLTLATPNQRLAAREAITARLVAWLAMRSPTEAAEQLQAAGVPAAPMLRIAELPGHPYFRDRGFYRVESHPWLKEEVVADAYLARSADLPTPCRRPAPLSGEQTAEVVSEWLGLSDAAIAELNAAQTLEPLADETRRQAESYMSG